MNDQIPGQSLDGIITRLQGDLQELVHVLVGGLKRQLSPHGIDAVEYTVLSICLGVGPTSIRDLRKLVPIDHGHMSRTISQLSDKGLIQRYRLRPDRRVVNLRLTGEGASLTPELMGRVRAFYADLIVGISLEELAGCIAVIEKMISAMEDRGAESPGPAPDGAGATDTQDQSIESLVGTLHSSVTKLVNVMYQGIENRLSPFGLTVGEYSVLATSFSNEPITISGLAQKVPINVSRISRIVSKLEDWGLIRKVRPKENRRIVNVETTDKGRALALELMGSASEHYANVVSSTSEEELTGLIEFIETMTKNAQNARA